MTTGQRLYDLTDRLFPIHRTLAGPGTTETLRIISEEVGGLNICMKPSGSKVFDWTVPNEWELVEAAIQADGDTILWPHQDPLGVVLGSDDIDWRGDWNEFSRYIHTSDILETATPYVTNYYGDGWGLCMPQEKKKNLRPASEYRAIIQTHEKKGFLRWGELTVSGKTEKCILISTYICHPHMAIDNTAGIALATYLVKWARETKRRYTYRFAFVPETIGALCFLECNLSSLKENCVAGFAISCVGGDGDWNLIPTPEGGSLPARAARRVLPDVNIRSYEARGSDERQYTAPGVRLPVVSLTRDKHGEYPEYHTSADNMSLITPDDLQETYETYVSVLDALESNRTYVSMTTGEPMLGKRDLYPNLSKEGERVSGKKLLNTWAYCDGTHDTLQIGERLGRDVALDLETLEKAELIRETA